MTVAVATAAPVRRAPPLATIAARRYPALLALLCALAAAGYVASAHGAIARRAFPDPDDQLRLQQVRDWLGGQGWFDVTQYRLNPPFGVPMHWSRLVDVPIAAVILALRPLLGPAPAELGSLIAVPLMTLAACMAASAALARRLLSPVAGLAVAALVPFTVPAVQQMMPMRIDHHGWQVVLAALIARALLMPPSRRSGALAGALVALWLAISLEGLPFAVTAAALSGLRWLLAPAAERARFEGFALALGGGSLALFVATRGGAAWRAPVCDAVSPVHLGALAVAALGTLLVTRLAAGTRARRIAGLALLGGACGAAYAAIGPRCVGGAFAELDPLVMTYWYRNVLEGQPLWAQRAPLVVMVLGFPLIGLAGAALRLRTAGPGARGDWASYAVLLIGATLASVLVQRSGAFSNILALPGALVAIAAAFGCAQRLRRTVPRVLASVAAVVALTPIGPDLASATITPAAPPPSRATPACETTANYATATALPTGILLTGIDIGPGLLLATPQRVLASSHHRNRAGIHDVLATFLGSTAEAHAIVRRRGVTYLVICPDSAEMGVYRRAAPRGFWAQLARGRTPPWLAPAPIPGSTLRVWKVTG